MRLLLATSLLTLTCISPGIALAAEQKPSPLEPLLQAISERLTIADQVALSKWDSGKAVEDPPREQQVISAAQARAAEFKLNPDDVQRLFRTQIEANKRVQNALLEQGTRYRTPEPGRRHPPQTGSTADRIAAHLCRFPAGPRLGQLSDTAGCRTQASPYRPDSRSGTGTCHHGSVRCETVSLTARPKCSMLTTFPLLPRASCAKASSACSY